MKRLYYPMLLTLFGLVAGCASTYVQDYYFTPHPVTKEIASTQPAEPSAVSAYATVIGIRNANKKLGTPASMEVRLRIDNNSEKVVSFNTDSMRLTSGTLVRFPAPIIASDSVKISRGESGLITAEFPFPDGRSYKKFDLHTLILHWTMRIGGRHITETAQFHRQVPRAYPYYYYYGNPYWGYDPYFYGGGPYFGGAVIIDRGGHWHR